MNRYAEQIEFEQILDMMGVENLGNLIDTTAAFFSMVKPEYKDTMLKRCRELIKRTCINYLKDSTELMDLTKSDDMIKWITEDEIKQSCDESLRIAKQGTNKKLILTKEVSC